MTSLITTTDKRIIHADSMHTVAPEQHKVHASEPWQRSLSQAITNPKQLFERLQLDYKYLDDTCIEASNDFKVFVTESYLKRIKPGDINDPLLRQVLPLGEEMLTPSDYLLDPLEEMQSSPVPGLLHKYEGRALLICNGYCAINCRFCFRRNYPYSENHYSSHHRSAIYQYLMEHQEISELILSGGDPLLLSNRYLREIFELAASIPHLRRLRIHSRVPIVLPERIDSDLLNMLRNSQPEIVMVLHCNHAHEISPDVSEALALLKPACHSLLNQSVLLKGVNDSADVLMALQEALFANKVQSYYLHLLDKVRGVSHFDLPLAEAKSIYAALAKRCPGYMLPKLVQEHAGFPFKIIIASERNEF